MYKQKISLDPSLLTGKMVGVVLSGTDLAAEIKNDLKKQVEELQNNDPTFKPGLVIVQVIC